MKRTILLTVVLVATFCSAQAQVAIKAGINLASLSEAGRYESDDIDKNSILGFQAGLAYDLKLTDIFTIQPELLFIQKGGKSVVGSGDTRIENKVYYNFVEVPVMFKLKFNSDPEGEGMGFSIVGGPFVGMALGAKYKSVTIVRGETISSIEDDVNFENDDSSERQRRLDYGVGFGAGIQFGNILLDARYNLGLNNLLDNDANNNNDDKPFLRTRGIGVTLGYQF